MIVKGIQDEDFVNYKLPSMTIITSYCTFKCGAGCQNAPLAHAPKIDVPDNKIVKRYIKNPITKAIVFAGLEPFDQWTELYELIEAFRLETDDPIVIYTGYTKEELESHFFFGDFKEFSNIIIKYGRYVPNQEKHYDEILGVYLASPNQYAEVLT